MFRGRRGGRRSFRRVRFSRRGRGRGLGRSRRRGAGVRIGYRM